METTEGNKLIAEFMEVPVIMVRHVIGRYVNAQKIEDRPAWQITENLPYEGIKPMWINFGEEHFLRYHKSWDWLMPVVEKIKTISSGFSISDDETWILTNIPDQKMFSVSEYKTIIENTWNAVIQFIQWYNEQKQSA